MDTKYKVILVDDHDMFRDGIKMLLNNGNIADVIAEATNGTEFLNIIDNYSPDIVLMDIDMPGMNGIDATQEAVEKHPNLKVLALSMSGDEEIYYKMIHAGVKGFVLKTSGISELEKATLAVCKGESYFSNELLRKIIANMENTITKANEKQTKTNNLTKRETEVLEHICKGLSNPEIAKTLFISETTVKTHRANLLVKANCNNTASLVMYAIKNDIVKI